MLSGRPVTTSTLAVALHSARKATAALPGLPVTLNSEGRVPDWIQVLTASPIKCEDGRGPYKVADAAMLIAESMNAAGGRLPVDENHSTDLAAPQGNAAPARGWIVELQNRADGLWARVEWTKEGAGLLVDKAYRFISPVFTHRKDGTILQLLRAALTNTPNLSGIAALNSEGDEMEKALLKLLGLGDDADSEAVLQAVTALKDKAGLPAEEKAAPTALASIAKAAGVAEDAKPEAVLQAVTALAAKKGEGDADNTAVKELQTQLATVTTELNTTKEAIAKDKATAAIDAAIKDGRVGITKPMRDHYIARHMKDAEAVDKEIAGMPKLVTGGVIVADPAKLKDGEVALNAEHRTVAKMLGIPEAKYAETLKAERDAKEAA